MDKGSPYLLLFVSGVLFEVSLIQFEDVSSCCELHYHA